MCKKNAYLFIKRNQFLSCALSPQRLIRKWKEWKPIFYFLWECVIVFHGEYSATHLKLACLKTTFVNNKAIGTKSNLRKTGPLTTWVKPELVQLKTQSRHEFTQKIKVVNKLNTFWCQFCPLQLKKARSFSVWKLNVFYSWKYRRKVTYYFCSWSL